MLHISSVVRPHMDQETGLGFARVRSQRGQGYSADRSVAAVAFLDLRASLKRMERLPVLEADNCLFFLCGFF